MEIMANALLAVALTAVFLTGSAAEAGDRAVIENSGSTNTAGFQILIEKSGAAEYVPGRRRRDAEGETAVASQRRSIPRELARRFYADLEAAAPLHSLPTPHCMKSVSFGTRLTVTMGSEKSPDLSCGDGGNAALGALIRDVNEIVALFGDKALHREYNWKPAQ
jgi:hypothetical protein